jgi:hypothetical protein
MTTRTLRTICTIAAVAGLLVPAGSAAALHAADDAGVRTGDSSSTVVEHPCFRVPLNWLIADSGPLPTCPISRWSR